MVSFSSGPSRWTDEELQISSGSRRGDYGAGSEFDESAHDTGTDLARVRTSELFGYLNLESGEEPLSIIENVEPVQYQRVYERQRIPKTVARERKDRKDWTVKELVLRLRLLNDVHEPSTIRDGLYISNFETAVHYLSGKGNKEKSYPKIGYVLSLINFPAKEAHLYDALEPEDPEEFPDGTRLLVNVKDSKRVNLMELFPTIINFIVHALTPSTTYPTRPVTILILIHCRKGMSRFVAAAMSYLIWSENKSVIDIWQDVVSRRIVAWPNEEFYTQLCMWAMWNCELTEGGESPRGQYVEYVVEKGLMSAVVGVKADLTAHLGLRRSGGGRLRD